MATTVAKPSAANVSAAKPSIAGAVSVAPVGTALPTTATEELNEAFTRLGYVTEDGLTNTMSITTEPIKAWGGDVVLNTQTEKTDSWKFALMEVLNAAVLKAAYGDANVSGTLDTGLIVKANSLEAEPHSYVFDMIMNGNVLKRIVIPSATVSALEDIVYKSDSAVVFGQTIIATPDEDGNTHYEYIQKKGAAA